MSPPKAKYTREEILACAFEILRREGPGALSARHLGEELGGSSRPIFTVFSGMDEVKEGTLRLAKDLYAAYVDRGLLQIPPFKGVGMEYIRFAAEEPVLFRLLFMAPDAGISSSPRDFLRTEENYSRVLQALTDFYGLPHDTAERIYRHLWIYCHGIAALTATGVDPLNLDEAGEQMTDVFTSLLAAHMKGRTDD